MTKNVYRSSCKVPVILAYIRSRFSNNPQISNLIKICPVGAGFFHSETDRQTGTHDKPNSQDVFTRLNRVSTRSGIQI